MANHCDTIKLEKGMYQEAGRSFTQVLERLAASAGVRARLDGDCALFLLSPDTRFEDLDYLWGSLFDLLA